MRGCAWPAWLDQWFDDCSRNLLCLQLKRTFDFSSAVPGAAPRLRYLPKTGLLRRVRSAEYASGPAQPCPSDPDACRALVVLHAPARL